MKILRVEKALTFNGLTMLLNEYRADIEAKKIKVKINSFVYYHAYFNLYIYEYKKGL